ncbi:hypothetical protein CBR_g63070 [Chara braunii]|uniref:U2A'/phosphoprotein 32 family A C-terminal domain-containing protein n=1 Tax=Chara braunii TaxID=69332 RepID=A0A388K8V1_CHABU|nr:hypothetical protein CBR_g63070 [Chara braunii]|eukprot:GBG66488.1 hypothetical protein CBR_g63070 [Chara braunii]
MYHRPAAPPTIAAAIAANDLDGDGRGQLLPPLVDETSHVDSSSNDPSTNITMAMIIDRSFAEDFIDQNPIEDVELAVSKLTHLELDREKIARIDGALLPLLPNLTNLYLQHNLLESIKPLEAAVNLRFLTVSSNRLREIEGMLALKNLMFLDVSYNQIQALDPATNGLPLSLRFLDTRGNPCCSRKRFRDSCVNVLRNLIELNGVTVSRLFRKKTRFPHPNHNEGGSRRHQLDEPNHHSDYHHQPHQPLSLKKDEGDEEVNQWASAKENDLESSSIDSNYHDDDDDDDDDDDAGYGDGYGDGFGDGDGDGHRDADGIADDDTGRGGRQEDDGEETGVVLSRFAQTLGFDNRDRYRNNQLDKYPTAATASSGRKQPLDAALSRSRSKAANFVTRAAVIRREAENANAHANANANVNANMHAHANANGDGDDDGEDDEEEDDDIATLISSVEQLYIDPNADREELIAQSTRAVRDNLSRTVKQLMDRSRKRMEENRRAEEEFVKQIRALRGKMQLPRTKLTQASTVRTDLNPPNKD